MHDLGARGSVRVRRRRRATTVGVLAGWLRERRGRLALLPAHAAPADLLECQPGVERDRVEQLPGGHRPREDVEVEITAARELGDHGPPGPRLALAADRGAQALQAS